MSGEGNGAGGGGSGDLLSRTTSRESTTTTTGPTRAASTRLARRQKNQSARSSRDSSPARTGTPNNASGVRRSLDSARASMGGPSTPARLVPAASSRASPQHKKPEQQHPQSNLPHQPHHPASQTSSSHPPQQAPPPQLSTKPSIVLLREGSDQAEDPELPSGMRTPRSHATASPSPNPNSGLATVVEADKIVEATESDRAPEKHTKGHSRTSSVASSIVSASQNETESESGYRSEDRPLAVPAKLTAPPSRSNSLARRQTVMGGADQSSRNMTVETETVSSVPQVALGTGGAQGLGGASIRSKRSTDTIRAPRKEKKKPNKRNTAGSGAQPSSKADIFAAKIAEAVDEANSSDSDETFVYESNPPEPPAQRPQSRFHSRTPSATSIQGGPDPRGPRLPLLSNLDGSQTTGRKGMKFVNNSLKMDIAGIFGDGNGSERGGSSREAARGMKERNGSSRHKSILADDNPFHRPSPHKASTSSLRHVANSQASSRNTSVPSSPRHSRFRDGSNNLGPSRKSPRMWSSYEADAEAADDEEAPLIATNRTRGTRRSLRPSGSIRQSEHNHRRRGCMRNYAGCVVAVATMIMIMAGVGGFLIATTNALQGVQVTKIENVLVSKQEIMLDLVVQAMNPNLIQVTVGAMDVNVFAKSRHVREDGGNSDDGDNGEVELPLFQTGNTMVDEGKAPRAPVDVQLAIHERLSMLPFSRPRPDYHVADNVDDGTDPIPEPDKETMLLGRIFRFDSALLFDGSPFRHDPVSSTGELRLTKPGNKTEEGGTERWERVLQHPFELIVRGILKYQLPLSGRVRTAPISATTIVHPETDDLPVEAPVET